MSSPRKISLHLTAFLLALVLWAVAEWREVRAQQETGPGAWPQVVSRSEGGGAADGWSSQPALSMDGRVVAFTSIATNLVAGDRNGLADVFIHDLQTGITERVSLGPDGSDPNGWSYRPAISADGRLVAYTSTATNLVPGDTNGSADVFIYDRLAGQTSRVSLSTEGLEGGGWSDWASLSADGRYVAFSSSAPDLVQGDTNGLVDVFVHDRLTGQTRRISRTAGGGQLADPAGWEAVLSADGRWVAYQVLPQTTAEGARRPTELVLQNRVTGDSRRVGLGPGGLAGLSVSRNGGLALFALQEPGADGRPGNLRFLDAGTEQVSEPVLDPGGGSETLRGALADDANSAVVLGDPPWEPAQLLRRGPGGAWSVEPLTLPAGVIPVPGRPPALSADGGLLALVAVTEQGEHPVVVVFPLGEAAPFLRRVGGRVVDPDGVPLRNVVLSYGQGQEVVSDRQGYFSLLARPDRTMQLRPTKEGFTFEPQEIRLTAETEAGDLTLTGRPEALLEHARLDLGMPYSFHRGCESDEEGCGGPYHGFFAGYCTDLVLDAYQWGLEFNLQFALERDALIHPDHYYRWRNARNSHDMWRYFHYTGQILSHETPYLPGDVAFFDWDEDGIIDHVSLVSAVSGAGRPLEMLDATGVIEFNPSGLAAELEWEPFHERTVRGHGRWQGSYGPGYYEAEAASPALQVAVDAPHIRAELIDEQGRSLSAQVNQHRRPPGAPLPVPGGRYFDHGLGEVLSVLDPLHASRTYLLRLIASEDSVYHLRFQTVQDGLVTDSDGYAQLTLAAGETYQVGIALHDGPGLRFDLLPIR